MTILDDIASNLMLGSLLEEVKSRFGAYELLEHWKQGEFHHDLVLRLPESALSEIPGSVLVVATNCNGGVKEVLCFKEPPDRWALWHRRCPDNEEFTGALLDVLAIVRTVHWFDPCELLVDDTRSEYRGEYRKRARGGGWEPRS